MLSFQRTFVGELNEVRASFVIKKQFNAANMALLFNFKDDMNILKISAYSVAAIASAVLVGKLAIAQIAPPVSNQGVTAKLIGALSLQSQITEIGNRQLRLRLVTIAPGGMLALHDHKDRPSVEMLVKGSATEYRNNTPKLYKEGDAMIADVGTEHWWKNDSQEPAVLVAADIFNAPKN